MKIALLGLLVIAGCTVEKSKPRLTFKDDCNQLYTEKDVIERVTPTLIEMCNGKGLPIIVEMYSRLCMSNIYGERVYEKKEAGRTYDISFVCAE